LIDIADQTTISDCPVNVDQSLSRRSAESMAEIVLFHHAQGLTPGVAAFAEQLRAAGHTVHTPDLFDGRTFTTLDEGIAYAGSVGFGTILDRGVAVAEALAADLVYAGFSMGVMPAQKLAQTRAGARAALLIDACLPVTEFGDRWPDGVPVQVHGMDADPFFAGEGDLDAARALADSTEQAELFLYPGDVHLFADSSLPSYDRAATELLTERVLDFLSTRG
jgi:dienelactone hydrolase